jgi:hypothetical protein
MGDDLRRCAILKADEGDLLLLNSLRELDGERRRRASSRPCAAARGR